MSNAAFERPARNFASLFLIRSITSFRSCFIATFPFRHFLLGLDAQFLQTLPNSRWLGFHAIEPGRGNFLLLLSSTHSRIIRVVSREKCLGGVASRCLGITSTGSYNEFPA